MPPHHTTPLTLLRLLPPHAAVPQHFSYCGEQHRGKYTIAKQLHCLMRSATKGLGGVVFSVAKVDHQLLDEAVRTAACQRGRRHGTYRPAAQQTTSRAANLHAIGVSSPTNTTRAAHAVQAERVVVQTMVHISREAGAAGEDAEALGSFCDSFVVRLSPKLDNMLPGVGFTFENHIFR